jgi:hypothetical protein
LVREEIGEWVFDGRVGLGVLLVVIVIERFRKLFDLVRG